MIPTPVFLCEKPVEILMFVCIPYYFSLSFQRACYLALNPQKEVRDCSGTYWMLLEIFKLWFHLYYLLKGN